MLSVWGPERLQKCGGLFWLGVRIQCGLPLSPFMQGSVFLCLTVFCFLQGIWRALTQPSKSIVAALHSLPILLYFSFLFLKPSQSGFCFFSLHIPPFLRNLTSACLVSSVSNPTMLNHFFIVSFLHGYSPKTPSVLQVTSALLFSNFYHDFPLLKFSHCFLFLNSVLQSYNQKNEGRQEQVKN